MKSFYEQYKNQIETLAEQMLSEPMPVLTEELFALFETTGNRLKYEEVYFRRRKFLAVFGMAACIFKQEAYVEKLEEVLREICREECWALPAHVNRIENTDWRNTVDLFACETAQALAEIMALVKGISEELCETIRKEIEIRVLIPFGQNRHGFECADHNWNAVCCGSIGSAAIYLLADKETERLDAVLKRICHSLNFYLDGFGNDGACMEGIGYFTYGMTYFTGFAEQLLRYSKGRMDLFQDKRVQKIAEFQQKMYFHCGQTVSFSDGECQAKFRMGLTAFLAGQYDTVRIPDRESACDFETDPCYRFMGLWRDYLWTTDGIAAANKEKGSTDCLEEKQTEENESKIAYSIARHDILPSAQWSICESRNGAGFAIKGGHNGEPHNHNDIGSFLYVAEGEQLLCDLGAGEYTGDYFGAGRYDILCNSSEGHNVPILNGRFQKDGAQYKADLFEADGKGKTVMEFAGAYKCGADKNGIQEGEAGQTGADELGNIEKLTREAVFSLETGSLTITDRFEVSGPEAGESFVITENLVTQGSVLLPGEPKSSGESRTVPENGIIIQKNNASCNIQMEGSFSNLRCITKLHSNHEGVLENVHLIQWDVELKNAEKGEQGQRYGVSKYTIWQS